MIDPEDPYANDPDSGYVYFIQCVATGLIKIGHTNHNPKDRLRSLAMQAGSPVKTIAHFPGFIQDEREVQGMFEDLWSHGEWYRPDQRLLDYIEEVGTPWDEAPKPVRIPRPARPKPAATNRRPGSPRPQSATAIKKREQKDFDKRMGLYEGIISHRSDLVNLLEYRDAALAYDRAMSETEPQS